MAGTRNSNVFHGQGDGNRMSDRDGSSSRSKVDRGEIRAADVGGAKQGSRRRRKSEGGTKTRSRAGEKSGRRAGQRKA